MSSLVGPLLGWSTRTGFIAAEISSTVSMSSSLSSSSELGGLKFFVTMLGGTTLVICMSSSDLLSLLSSAHLFPLP